MATLNISQYNSSMVTPASTPGNEVRVIDVVVDLTSDVTSASSTDVINVARLPAGSVVLAAFLKQVTAGSSGNTLVARVGTVTMSGTLASDATAGTVTAQADVSGGAPVVLTADSELNMLSASGVRTTGAVRVRVVYVADDFYQPTVVDD